MTATVEELRAYYESSPMHAVLLEGLIPASVAAILRERVRPLLRPYYIADRGRYQVDETHAEPELTAGLADLAASVLQARVKPGRARWTRMGHGDYAMYKDDARVWAGLDHHAELVLDFSATGSEDGQVIYSTGSHVLWIPQVPCAGALVDRRQTIHRYDRYVTYRIGTAEIFRLGLALEIQP